MALSRRDLLAATFAAAPPLALAARDADRLHLAAREPLRNGWIAVRLAGAPNDAGYFQAHS